METNNTEAISAFREQILGFDIDAVEQTAARLMESGCSPEEVLGVAQECIQKIGEKFERGEYYLTELIVGGELFKKVSDVIKRTASLKSTAAPIATIVIGTPRGDIHCLGKDIFGVLAEASGFKVHDLGVDVEPSRFVRVLEETGATILGMSSLLTTAYASMREVMALLESKGLRNKVFVIIGGAATTKDMVAGLKVDAQTWDAYEGIRILKSLAARQEVRA